MYTLLFFFCFFFWLKSDIYTQFYSSFEVRPSENDLADQTSLISEAVKRNDALTKSKVCGVSALKNHFTVSSLRRS